ncbi:hypothetical protein C8R45DRAFT_170084 [Mycena sanguinolenta]|nr:hypothetical protein C8R45DRAFT_170084 [Mycena sanguinolenta]
MHHDRPGSGSLITTPPCLPLRFHSLKLSSEILRTLSDFSAKWRDSTQNPRFHLSMILCLRRTQSLRRIPTEILSEIFTFTLPPHHVNDEPAPWTISAVCSHWRQIVASQPRFWIFIDLRYLNRKRFTGKFRLQVETQLFRSSGLPLKITFTISTQTLSSEESSLLRLITLHARRWEILFLMGPKVLYTHLHGFIRD